MPRRRVTVPVGPWPGGVNTRDHERLLQDGEATEIINWDVEDNGALVPRRGWYQTDTGYAKAWPLCIYVANSDNSRAICSLEVVATTSAQEAKFFYTAGPVPSVSMLKNQASAEIQRAGRFVTGFLYNGKIYFVPDTGAGIAAGVGFYKTDTTYGGASDDPVDVASMPAGKFSWVMNDRAFIFNPRNGRLYWSKATDATTWLTSGSGTPGVDEGGYVDIDPNDNPFLDCVVVHDTVYFIRMDKIYTFRFSSDPSTDGQVSQIANGEGAVAGCAYNNNLVLVTPRGLFYFQNGYYTLITDKVKFTDAQGELMAMSEYNEVSVIDHTLVATLLTGDSTTIEYGEPSSLEPVYYRTVAVNMHTGAASMYEGTANIFTPYGKALSDGKYTYRMAKQTNDTTQHAYVIAIPHERDFYNNVGGREDYYSLTTKLYDFGMTRSVWKRLRTATIDYELGADRVDQNVTVTLASETESDGTQGDVDSPVLTTGVMGRIRTPNVRFRTLQVTVASTGGGVNTDDGTVRLRQLLLLLSVGEFEEFQAV